MTLELKLWRFRDAFRQELVSYFNKEDAAEGSEDAEGRDASLQKALELMRSHPDFVPEAVRSFLQMPDKGSNRSRTLQFLMTLLP